MCYVRQGVIDAHTLWVVDIDKERRRSVHDLL